MKLLIFLAILGAFRLSIGLFVISSLIMGLMTKLRKLFKKNKKKVIIYVLVLFISFGIIGLLSSSKVLNDIPLNSFFGFQFLFLILGILHVYFLRKYFEELSQDESNFLYEFLFTIAFLCIGLIAFSNVVYRFRPSFDIIFMSSSILFIIPMLFYRLYEFAMLIPVPVYKQWLYPVSKNIKDPTKEELVNLLVISFEFKKSIKESEITNFRVKAPQAMEFGKLFYFFILDYNERHPENKIEYLDNNSQKPYSWTFYYKPKWWSSVRHIDFSHTISANSIKENTVIVCNRVV